MCQPPKPKSQHRLAALFISSRINRSRRLEYATELMRYIDVHSYSEFRRNHTPSDDDGRRTKLEGIAAYKFTLAFENAIGEDYVTEKFFDPLVAGSVPVYLGAPNVDLLAPNDHCYIAAFAELYYRKEQAHGEYKYLQGLMLPIERKSIELMALALDGGEVQAMQPFIGQGQWQDEALLQQHWRLVDETLGEADGSVQPRRFSQRCFHGRRSASLRPSAL
jgi:Glycosyltransferase family 10 (fucosyltransferase) C-term/DDE superfamily endonuclease